jgi:hypothetical protein
VSARKPRTAPSGVEEANKVAHPTRNVLASRALPGRLTKQGFRVRITSTKTIEAEVAARTDDFDASNIPLFLEWMRIGGGAANAQKTWLSPNQIVGPRPVPTPTGCAMSTRRLARSRKEKRIVSTRMPTPTPWTTGPQSPRRYDWPTS